jgi:hypothetical protein
VRHVIFVTSFLSTFGFRGLQEVYRTANVSQCGGFIRELHENQMSNHRLIDALSGRISLVQACQEQEGKCPCMDVRPKLVQQVTIDAIMIMYYFQPQSTSTTSEEIYEIFLARRKSTCQKTNRTRNLSDPVCLSFPPVKPLGRSTTELRRTINADADYLQ